MLPSFLKEFSAATFLFTSHFYFDYHNPATSHEGKTPLLEITNYIYIYIYISYF
jgi:hypothetical protein